MLRCCLDTTAERRRAGSDPLRSAGTWASVEEDTAGTEPLLPETAVSPSGRRIWRYLVVGGKKKKKKSQVQYLHISFILNIVSRGEVTCSVHHTSIHLSGSTCISGRRVGLVIHADIYTLHQICMSRSRSVWKTRVGAIHFPGGFLVFIAVSVHHIPIVAKINRSHRGNLDIQWWAKGWKWAYSFITDTKICKTWKPGQVEQWVSLQTKTFSPTWIMRQNTETMFVSGLKNPASSLHQREVSCPRCDLVSYELLIPKSNVKNKKDKSDRLSYKQLVCRYYAKKRGFQNILYLNRVKAETTRADFSHIEKGPSTYQCVYSYGTLAFQMQQNFQASLTSQSTCISFVQERITYNCETSSRMWWQTSNGTRMWWLQTCGKLAKWSERKR